MPQFGGASEKCQVCAKTVYLQEKIVVEDKDEKKTFHKMCLKCSHCKSTLSLGNYASMNGVFYCKPHFKQLFATKGNYDEGFGKEKLTSKWAPNAAPAASTAGSFVPVEKEETSKPVFEKKDSSSPVVSKFGSSEKCEKCSKTVYATEKIVIEEKDGKKVFHKNCLKCTHCQNLLSLGNYASMNGVTYCKPHFKQLFAAKGNYDEGFGKEKHTTKWEATAGAAPTTFVPVERTDSPKTSASTSVSDVANRFKSTSVSDKCTACGKTVYLTERTVVEDKEVKKVFHKACLRCTHCQVVLSLGNYASMGGVMYCKPHFKQLFASKGNYDEGFGKQKHSAKWIEQDNPEQTTTATTSEKHDDAQHKEHSFATTSSSHHAEDTHKHEEHKHEEHKHEEHKHEEHKHEEHEHKHEQEHKHEEHKHEEHEHHEHKHEEHEHHEHKHEEHEHHEHKHDDHEHHAHDHEHDHEHKEHEHHHDDEERQQEEEPIADDE